jgi:hypothetical protein
VHWTGRIVRIAVVLLTGILIGSLFVGVAQSLTAPDFTYATKQTGHAVITPADLQPESYTTQWFATQGDLEGAGCYIGSIHIPQGSRIVSIDIHETEGVSAPLDLRVLRDTLTTGAEKVKDVPPTTDGSRQTFTISVPSKWNTIDNTLYTFSILVCQDPSGSFHGASVKYSYTSAGD